MQLEFIDKPDNLQISEDKSFLKEIEELDNSLTEHFANALIFDVSISRKIVSFQANKSRTYYRWYKYKEAFSAALVEYLFQKYSVRKGSILDPFAGAGTALFAASALGYRSEGIEVLPLGQKIITANIIARSANKEKLISGLHRPCTAAAVCEFA
jgi:DNA modification methylase